MRILMMADVTPDRFSGAAGTELETAEALRRQGAEVDTIWAPQLGRRIRHGNLHYLLELPRSYRRAMLQAFSSKSYDVVHVNQPHGFLAAEALARQSRYSVFIHRSHGLELHVEEALRPWLARFDPDRRSPLRRLASPLMQHLLLRHTQRIVRSADGHIVSSSGCADFLEQRLGVGRDQIAAIAQGLSDSFSRIPQPGMNSERLQRLLYVGQFAFVKAPVIVAEAMSTLLNSDPRLEASWVCAREHHDQLRALLAGPARDRVRLLSWMNSDELREVYDRHGIFLFPSFFEGFGKAFLEAMSRGLCVVASDVGGAHDVIEHGRTGLLVPPGNAEAVIDAARRLLSNPEQASSMSVAAAVKARGYTWDGVAQQILEFYRRRLAAKRGGARP